jgi:type II secretion system protein N
MELKIDELGLSWLTRASVTGVHFISPATEPGKPPSDLKIDSASVSLLSAMFGNLSFKADAFGGTIKGDIDESSKERKIDFDIDGVDLSQMTMIAQSIGIPLEGSLSGTGKVTEPDLKVSKATGSASLQFTNLAAGDGKAKIGGMLALPKISIGTLDLAGDVKDGVLKLTKASASGKDLDLQGDGRIQLREQLADSFADATVKLKISDAYRGKNDSTKSLFGTPGSNVPALMDLDPRMKQAKRPDGSYALHVHGIVSRLQFDAAPVVATPGATPGGKGP